MRISGEDRTSMERLKKNKMIYTNLLQDIKYVGTSLKEILINLLNYTTTKFLEEDDKRRI
eukprot:snap_masked-scaffold_5-processed-gene-8.29-mRNA-1 protein AED:1.00 eAED:1.00 QI:0/-1/0/0/-1/1/1/0/59